ASIPTARAPGVAAPPSRQAALCSNRRTATASRRSRRPRPGAPLGKAVNSRCNAFLLGGHGGIASRLAGFLLARIPPSGYSRPPPARERGQARAQSLRGRRAEGHVARDGELDLGPRARAAPEPEVSAHALRALAHARESPMAVAPGAQHFGVDAPAVVADEKPQLLWRVLHLQLDPGGVGVTDGVHQRLPPDAIDVVADHRVQRAGVSLAGG